jgi:protease I
MRVAILATDGFEQAELIEPRQAFTNEGAATIVVSPKSGAIQGYQHDEKADFVGVDLPLSDARPEQFDALQLPGGVINSDRLRLVPAAVAFVGAFANGNKPIAAICHGLWTMADADVLMGRKVTSWPSLKTDLTNAGAHWEDQPVVDDQNFVTSRKPEDIPAFNEHAIVLYAKYRGGKPAIGGGPSEKP